MRITVDRERCMGSGNCEFHAPSTFELDDEMKAVVVDTNGDGPEAVALAADGCPTKAIGIAHDLEPGQQPDQEMT